MALMKFREPNQVKWCGVRPGHNGTFTSAELRTAAAAWSVVYTVPVNTRLYIFHSWMSAINAGLAGNARIRIVYGGVAHQLYIVEFEAIAGGRDFVDTSYYFPLELEANDTFEIYVSNAGIAVWGGFNGFLENI